MIRQSPSPRTRPVNLKDARRRTVTLLDSDILRTIRNKDAEEAKTLEIIADEIDTAWPKWPALIEGACTIVLFGALVVACLLSWHVGFPPGGRWDFFLFTIGFVAGASGLCRLWNPTRWERRARTRRIMLRHKRCPHCAYDIRLLPTDPADGATICPECGSAWILPEDAPASPSGDGARDHTPDP